ncbi:MAG: V-type ATP synthase subunit D [Candidatus Cloacimonas sp. 4484_209]|nr:MAG: V-type ATP synthase subunit D [Candidatus Cloacimonas sp. 4484_209]
MILDINPTRMELLRLKKKLILAKRGHKLLKDKQDELMKQLLELVDIVREMREKVDKELSKATARYLFAKAGMQKEFLEGAMLVPGVQINLLIKEKSVMGVKTPVFEVKSEGNIQNYGYVHTSGELDASLITIAKAIEMVIHLAEKEKTVQLMAEEIEKTRRRVNALEYILIPNLEDTIKYITMKLSEMERSNLTRLMKVKDIVRSH